MSAVRVLSGANFNLLSRALTVTASQQDSLYPVSGLYDYDPSHPWRNTDVEEEDEVVDNVTITADLAMAQGDFEAAFVGGVPDSEVLTPYVKTGPGTLVATTTAGEFHSGAAAVKIQVGASETTLYYDYTVRPGETLRADMWLRRGPLGSATANIRIRNRRTGMYLTGAGAWQAGLVSTFTSTDTSYEHKQLTFVMEGITTCLQDEVKLRVSFLATGGGASTDNACFDDCFLAPAWNFSSVHGSTLAPALVTTLRSSDDNFSSDDVEEAVFVVAQPSFYTVLPALRVERYVRLKMLGPAPEIITIGEWVVGQTVTLTQAQNFPLGQAFVEQDIYAEGLAGNPKVHNISYHPRRRLGLEFRANTLADFEEAKWHVFRRSRGRFNPLVYVPIDDRPECYFGLISNEWETSLEFLYTNDYSFSFLESAFFAVGL